MSDDASKLLVFSLASIVASDADFARIIARWSDSWHIEAVSEVEGVTDAFCRIYRMVLRVERRTFPRSLEASHVGVEVFIDEAAIDEVDGLCFLHIWR